MKDYSIKDYLFSFNLYPDVIRLTEREELEDILHGAFSKDSIEDSVVVLRSNKRANIYNQQIRNRILWYENEITSGDHLMVVKNNYSIVDLRGVAVVTEVESLIDVLSNFDEIFNNRTNQNTISGKQFFIMHERLVAIAGKNIPSFDDSK